MKVLVQCLINTTHMILSQIEVYGRGTSEEPLTRHRSGWDSSQWSNNNEDYWNTY